MTSEPNNQEKILVIEAVEDDTLLRNALKEKLSLEGFKVIEAKDGEEGLNTALKERPDLILLDILMPKVDGLQMMRKLRTSNTWGKNVPVILLTNLNAADERINNAIATDEPAYYLIKANLSINDLVDKIKERLSRQF